MADCSIETDSLDHITKLRKDANRVFNALFGEEINNIAVIDNDIAKAAKNLEVLENELRYAKKQLTGKLTSKRILELKGYIKNTNRRLKALERNRKEYPQKRKMIARLRKIMVDRVLDVMDDSGYSVDPSVLFSGMKDILGMRIGVFGTIDSGWDMQQVASALTFVQNAFNKQDKNVKKLKLRSSFAENWRKGSIGWWADEIKDPLMAMLDYDVTGKGTAYVEKTKEYIAKRYAKSNEFKNKFTAAVQSLYDLIDSGGAYYRIQDSNATLVDQKKESRSNLEKIASEILDGEVKFVKPANIYKIDGNKLSFTEEFKEDRKEYEEKLRRNLTNKVRKLRKGEVLESGKKYKTVGIYDGGDIQKYTDPEGNDFYYIPILRIVDGKEVWNAYEVPTRDVDSGGKTVKQMLFPNDILSNEEFRNFFIGKESSGRTIASMDGKADRMPTGWMRSQAWIPLKGQSKVKGKLKKWQTSAYSEYTFDDQIETEQNQLPSEFWDAISGIRLWSKDVYAEAQSRTFKTQERMTKLATESRLRTKDGKLTDVLDEILQMDLFNNLWVNKNGQIVSVNSYMGQRDLHMPWAFSEVSTINNLGETRNEVRKKIGVVDGSIAALVAQHGDAQDITDARSALMELKALEDNITDMLDALAGKEVKDRPPISQESALSIAMHRGAASQPFENEDTGYTGRRKDFGVFTEYSDDIMKKLSQNELKADLVHSLEGVSPAVRKFIIDQTLSTFNIDGAEAKLFGFNFGDANVKRILEKYSGGLLDGKGLMSTLALYNELVSGNLLGMGSALNNNWQRLSIWIEANEELYLNAENLPDEIREKIVTESGVDDVMQSIGEALMVASGVEPNIWTGLHTRKDLALLWLEKPLFIDKFKRTATFKAWVEGMAERGGFDTSDAAMSIFLETQWEVAHGVAEGTFSDKERKSIRAKLKKSNMSGIANKFLHFGLSGGVFYGAFKRSDALARAFAFMPVEREMRKETAVIGALMAVSNMKTEDGWLEYEEKTGKSRYSHPEVLAFSRQVVNATMFGMSPQFQNKAFRGNVGKTVFKFKSYQAQQLRTELRVYQSWKDSLKQMPLSKAAASRARVFKFWDTDSMSKLERRVSKLIMSRMLITSLQGFAKMSVPALHGMYKIWKTSSSKFLGTNAGSLQRGGDSMLAGFWISIFQVLAGVLNVVGGDDEEDIYDNALRYFLPIYLNSAVDTTMAAFSGQSSPKDLWDASRKVAGIYSRGLEVGIDLVGDLVTAD